MEYFGTDGIRWDEGKFSDEFLKKVAFATLKAGYKHVLIGRDTRPSGVRMETALSHFLSVGGGTVELVGVLTTPALAYLTSRTKNAVGIMLSASHNPYTDNGIKFFRGDGSKFTEFEEEEIERGIREADKEGFPVAVGGKVIRSEARAAEYSAYFVSIFKNSLKNKKIVLDGANGGGSFLAPQVLRALGAEVRTVFCDGIGTKINDGSGATHPETLKGAVKAGEIGISLDGDGDRCIAVANGEIFDGDAQLYVAALDLKRRKKLTGNTVVGTLMTNMGLEKCLETHGIGLERVNVGDKYISRRMTEKGYRLGGETSGHLIFPDTMPTGDGLLSGIIFALAEERTRFTPYFQAHSDFKTDDEGRAKFLQLSPEIWATEMGRTVVRLSGTEGKVRVMAECPDRETAERLAKEIAEKIKAAIK